MGFGISIIVALLGTILFAIATRYDGAYSTAEIYKPINKFVSSANNYIFYGPTGEWGSATEEETKLLESYVKQIKTNQNKLDSQSDSTSDFLIYTLLMFPFNTYILIDFRFGGSSTSAFLSTILTYVFAAIFIAIYSHVKNNALKVQEENARLDKLLNEFWEISSGTDFSSLQNSYRKLNEILCCAGDLSRWHDKSTSAHNLAGALSLVSLVATLLFSL